MLHLGQQAGFFEVELCDLRARRERGLDPGFAREAQRIGLLRDQPGGDDVARIAGIGATGDRGDDDRAVGHFAGSFFPLAGNAALGEFCGRQAPVRVGGPARLRSTLTGRTRARARTRPVAGCRPTGRLRGIVFDQRHLFGFASGQFQVVDGLLVDVEHRRRGAILRRHVGNRCAVADGQARGAVAEKLEVGGDHARLAQEFGEREHDIGRGDAGLALTAQAHADDVGQAHHRWPAEHDGFGFEAADADGDHAEAIDVRRVTVGADTGVREGHAVACLDHRRHLFQVDLVHDAVTGRDHVDVIEGAAGPVDEIEAVRVAAVLDGTVLVEGVRVEAGVLDGERMIDDELGRHYRVDARRVTALVCDRIAQAGEIDQRGLAENVVADHACRVPGKIQVAAALDDLSSAASRSAGSQRRTRFSASTREV